ncbi:hypothetical protein BDC45DRAFT_576669 [Circinella umbellata]|nr:hypothetical protein BDC45DRAFT_576669 [Circinella umbellata]
MPPKTNINNEVAELRRQATDLSNQIGSIYTELTNNAVEFRTFKESYDRQQLDSNSLLRNIKEGIESLHVSIEQNNASNNETPTSEGAEIPQQPVNKDKIIIAPHMIEVGLDGTRTRTKIPIKKDHIISLVIKRNSQEMTDESAEGLYQTVVNERNQVLEAFAGKLNIVLKTKKRKSMHHEINNNSSLDPQINISQPRRMVPVSWAKLNELDKNMVIDIFERCVFEKIGVDISVCEKSWTAEHVLSESWNNMMGPAKRLYAEYKTNLRDNNDTNQSTHEVLNDTPMYDTEQASPVSVERQEDTENIQDINLTQEETDLLNKIMTSSRG